MTRVEVKMPRTWCDEIEILRSCHKTRDYSMMLAAVERLQLHGDAMESALDRDWKMKRYIQDKDTPNVNPEEFKEQVIKLGEKRWGKREEGDG